jgi:hypothetical protein
MKRIFEMKTSSVPSPISLNVIILAMLFVAVVFVAVTGKKVPVISNTRVAMVILLLLGMAMCTSGIGRVAAIHQWTHPLSILGYLLGALILVIGLATTFGLKLPYIQSDVQAIVWVTALVGAKVLDAVLHGFLSSGA